MPNLAPNTEKGRSDDLGAFIGVYTELLGASKIATAQEAP